ncbi:MAG: bifunctional 5,10-methylenetetrahydrofolate dehydrogenase/5,10-methenyltetrahydrofolate cyclohydrolase [Bilifractor sp.]|jgi:methylenetetrahydrofolate dehydrogenase (NADP+)/methenyltetrahydrofolate cyclohydrolase
MAELLKGAPVAAALTEEYASRVEKLKEKGISPTLAILRVGEKPDDLSYERGATKRAEKMKLAVKKIVLPADVTQEKLIETIRSLNADPAVHGVLMFRPLPGTLDERAACEALDPAKDIDGITAGSMARVYSGSGTGFPPCTAQAVMEILKYYKIDPKGKRVAVIGRSLVIGRPVAMLLMQANATVTICHTKTVDVASVAREADIVVAAVGHAGAVTADYCREGQIVIDVGINYSEEKKKLVGDVDFDAVSPVVSKITPVPGGVGAVTTAVLCSHVVEAASQLS